MNALRYLALTATAVLLLGVVPDLGLRPLYFHSPAALAAVAVLVPATLLLFVGIERWIDWLTGYGIPFCRRMLIPVPAFLCIAATAVAITTPVGGYGSDTRVDFYGKAVLTSLAVLPFLLLEDVRTPVRFVLGVWAAYLLWGSTYVMVMIKLRAMWPD